MKKLILLSFILFFCCAASNAEYYYYGSNVTSSNKNYAINSVSNTYSKIGDTYYNGNLSNPTSYTQQGNRVYGSDGSSYTIHNNTMQNNSTGQTYQINHNTITPLY